MSLQASLFWIQSLQRGHCWAMLRSSVWSSGSAAISAARASKFRPSSSSARSRCSGEIRSTSSGSIFAAQPSAGHRMSPCPESRLAAIQPAKQPRQKRWSPRHHCLFAHCSAPLGATDGTSQGTSCQAGLTADSRRDEGGRSGGDSAQIGHVSKGGDDARRLASECPSPAQAMRSSTSASAVTTASAPSSGLGW